MQRRDFLKFSVAASGGVLIGFYLPGSGSLASAEEPTNAFMPNAFVRIGTDERVTVIVNHSEMGQGVYTSLPMLLAGYHVPAFSTTNVDLPALDVLAELLFADRAPLYKRLVIKEQKVETMSGSADPHVDPNLFAVLARIKKPQDLGAVEKAIDDEIARLAKEGVDDKTLADVLSHVKYGFAAQLSTADKAATTAAMFVALTGDLASINAYFALYDKVTPADVKRVAQKYFAPANRTTVTLRSAK